MKMIVEPVTVEAAAVLAQCGAAWFDATFRSMIPGPALDFLLDRFERDAIARRIAAPEEAWWWARVGDECVGYAVLARADLPLNEAEAAEPASPVCYAASEEWAFSGALAPDATKSARVVARDFELARLYVSPNWHRRGAASQLMQCVRAEAALRGGTRLWLRVHAQNAGARGFYAANGFRLVHCEQLAVENAVLPHEILALPIEPDPATPQAWTIGPAEAQDAAELSTFAIRCFETTFAEFNSRENLDAYLDSALRPRHFQAALDAREMVAAPLGRGRELWVARNRQRGCDAGSVIAYSMLAAGEAPPCVDGQCPIELRRLYVDHAFHGAGLAGAMMDRVMERARIRGAKTIWLGVWERNLRAQAFYRKWGFERVGEKVFVVGDDPQIDWVMARPVDSAFDA